VVGCVRGVLGVHEFTIRGLIVHPSCQGQGIGSTLLKALEAVNCSGFSGGSGV
jgi:ribosomal protein S18 acetylase RimI-like enzyme